MLPMTGKICFVKCRSNAIAPRRAHPTDAGYDLFTPEAFHFKPGVVVKVPLGIKVELPEHVYGQIASRSGMASNGLIAIGFVRDNQETVGGVMDPAYRGEWTALMLQVPGQDVTGTYVPAGTKIAQLLILPRASFEFEEDTSCGLTETARGEGGFGSTGN